MESKLVLKIEQHFEDGTIKDCSDMIDELEVPIGIHSFGTEYKKPGKQVKKNILKEIQTALFKSYCKIEV